MDPELEARYKANRPRVVHLVISDRNVLDAQLHEAIVDFQRTTGVVAVITGGSDGKSGELAEALAGAKKIVVCTIQTFPFALQALQELAATEGKRFAVIADEAHRSQTGESAAKLKAVLSAETPGEGPGVGRPQADEAVGQQRGNLRAPLSRSHRLGLSLFDGVHGWRPSESNRMRHCEPPGNVWRTGSCGWVGVGTKACGYGAKKWERST